jgi:protein Tex
LEETLETVIESSVNLVGVDLNSASVPLLRHVSGLNQLAARDLVDYRKKNGPFKNREQLLGVPNIGPARFVQAAGFLKILDGDNPLDRTWIHPESYPAANKLLAEVGFAPDVLSDKEKTEALREKLKGMSPEEVCNRLEVGLPTLHDMIEALSRPGRDPREDLPSPIFKKGILKLEDLQPGMELKGTVLNVVDFGAFIDIGLKDSGLVHISQMANRYIKSPYELVSVSDVVTVWVLSVDRERRRVSLTMIKPGTQRRPPEKKPQPEGPSRSQRPPRGRRPMPAKRPKPAPTHPSASPPPPSPVATPVAAASTVSPTPPQPTTPAPRPAPPPRKPPRRMHRPKLTQEALQGETPLRTFSELMAFFQAKHEEEKPAVSESQPEPKA